MSSMKVEYIEFLVEEPSMEVALRAILPSILGGISFEVFQHQCKDELFARLPARLTGYRNWLRPGWRVVIVVDRDDDDCHELKARLEKMATAAGLVTKSNAGGSQFAVVNRVAIEELEAWYFGDWAAVRAAYPRASARVCSQANYRDPDAIPGGTWEALERILQQSGYFKGGLRKIAAARAIAPHMAPARNRSRSFQVFRDALIQMASQ